MSDTRKTTKPNVPNLRFPGFEGEWENKRIGDIGKFFSGGTPSSSRKDFYGGEIPFIRSGEIHSDKTELFLTQEGYKNSSAKMVEVGDILLALYGANSGDISISQMRGAINQAILCIRTNVAPVFFKSVWEKHAQKILNTYLQGGQGNLSADIVKKITISIPSQIEQAKIAALFSHLDERISIQNKVIEDLKKLKTALEERMLGQCQGKQVRLRDILIERVEKSRINNQYEVLSSTVSGIYSQREYFNKEIASADNTGYKAIHRGDVVLSPQNLWMGNINYNDRFEIGIVSPSYKVFSIDEKFDKGYIAFLLKTRKALWAYSLVSEQGASIVRRNLNYESFLEISFVIPSLKEQQATARRLSAFKQKQTMEEAFLRSLLLQKEFMLKSLFI